MLVIIAFAIGFSVGYPLGYVQDVDQTVQVLLEERVHGQGVGSERGE